MPLIELDDLIRAMRQEDKRTPGIPWSISGVQNLASRIPTIEATPVVHGRWEAVHDGWGRCPNCHRMDSIHEKATHCRFCGTKMDGGVSDA